MSDLKFGPNAMWEHRIRQRAYEIYEGRLRSHISSTDRQDWLDAEREVRNEIRGSQDIPMNAEMLSLPNSSGGLPMTHAVTNSILPLGVMHHVWRVRKT